MNAAPKTRNRALTILATIAGIVGLAKLLIGMSGGAAAVAERYEYVPQATVAAATSSGITVNQQGLLDRLKQRLPYKVDAVTTIRDFTFDAATLVYHYDAAGTRRADLDVAKYKAERFESFCKTLSDMYTPGELTAIRHQYRFTDGTELSLEVTHDECEAQTAADTKKFFDFVRDVSGGKTGQ